jgi:hypothetical protein
MKKLQILLVTVLVIAGVSSFTTKEPDVSPTSPTVPGTVLLVKPEPPIIAEPVVAVTEPEPVVVEPVVAVTEPEPVVEEPRYGFTDEEVYLLAQLLCGSSKVDGDGEYDFVYTAKYFPDKLNYCEISKVLCVVMNRVRSEQFPNTVSEVVLQKGQFSTMPKNAKKTPDDIAIQKVQEWCDAYDNWDTGVQNVPEDHLYFSAGPNLTNVTR